MKRARIALGAVLSCGLLVFLYDWANRIADYSIPSETLPETTYEKPKSVPVIPPTTDTSNLNKDPMLTLNKIMQ